MPHTINQQVSIWANGRLGRQVARGECWDLADLALKSANAKSSGDYGPVGDDDDYVWGNLVALKDVIAGDILQFRDFSVATETVTEITFDDGSSETDTEDMTVERPHHTAIVDATLGAGKFRILEQNVEPLGRKVQRNLLYASDVPAVVTTTRKTVKSDSGKLVPASVRKTVTVSVSGTIWAYRPQASGS